MRQVMALLGIALLAALLGYCSDPVVSSKQDASVDWRTTYQTIDGFGGAAADFLDPLTPAQADFFYTTAGIGLTILRTQIIPDRATCDAEFHKGGCGKSNGQILDGELETARLAAARGAIVVSTPWSPPGNYKSNGSFRHGGYLLPAHYSDWAAAIASYVSMMAQNGVPIHAVSVQNEPDLSTDYGSCIFTAQQIHDFVPFLSRALRAAGAESTKLMVAEESSWSLDLASAALADRTVAADLGILAAHAYHGRVQAFPTGGKPLWQTEDSSQSPQYDGSMSDGMMWADKIHDYLIIANVNAWLWWFLTDMPRQGEGADNAALTDMRGRIPKRTYVLGQWSRFVRPGWQRIEVESSGPVRMTGFKAPGGGSFAIVAINSSHSPILQTITLKGFRAGSITPWITSEDLSLAQQKPVSIQSAVFSYRLPAFSVTTFSGEASPLP